MFLNMFNLVDQNLYQLHTPNIEILSNIRKPANLEKIFEFLNKTLD